MEEDLPFWATILIVVLFGLALSSNVVWFLMLYYKAQAQDTWYKNPDFWKRVAPWSCVVVIVLSNGIVSALQTDDRSAKFSNGACAVSDVIACLLGTVLTFKLLLHAPNYGTGTGFICNLLFGAFKVAAADEVLKHKKTSWQAFGSMAMFLAIGSFVPVLHDLVEK